MTGTMAKKITQKTKTPDALPRRGRAQPVIREVTLGYTEDMAMAEAKRCIECKNAPCIEGCPVRHRHPELHQPRSRRANSNRRCEDAAQADNLLPAICGRVCPQEEQCEKCILGKKCEPVAIGRLERFVADYAAEQAMRPSRGTIAPPTGHEVAVIGAGPGGPHRGRRPRAPGPQGDHLRGAPQARRRAGLRHPGVPAAQGHRRARGAGTSSSSASRSR